jgi:TRAP-type C4-dicarboxylate transport system permease small subunit
MTALKSTYERIAGFLSAGVIAMIVLITTAQVFFRYLLNDPIYWAEEACRTLLIWACFLFAGIAFKRGEMATVEFATSALPPSLRNGVLAISYTITGVFLAILTYFGWSYANQNWIQPVPGIQMLMESIFGSGAGFSIFWLYVALPIGSAILSATMFWSALMLVMQRQTASEKN